MATPKGEQLRLVTRPGEVWVHIDDFRKKSRRVWAVQTPGSYRVASKIEIRTPRVETRFHAGRRGRRQPIAYLVARRARVRWLAPDRAVVVSR